MSRLNVRLPSSPPIDDSTTNGSFLRSISGHHSSNRSNTGDGTALTITPGRIPALDFTKGALVVIMVLYHWMNYFLTGHDSAYKYLRFLTPSFIFITGFLISHVYLSKYPASDLRIPMRLLVRGLKLLAIVACLNMVFSILHLRALITPVNNPHHRDIVLAYLLGTAPVAFAVLIPIGYLLILSAGLVVSKTRKSTYHITCVLSVAGATYCALTGLNSGYLEIFSIGTIGLSVGYAPIDRIDAIVKHRLILVLAYAAYLVAVTVWHEIYLLQIPGVFLSLTVIYLIGTRHSGAGGIGNVFILLGKYSLFAYIAQIGLLQVLQKGLRRVGGGPGVVTAALVIGFVCTVLIVEIVDRTRRSVAGFNRLYALVFS
jgi:peptidoglycan/LPS O-acetylase OafA/YrhL